MKKIKTLKLNVFSQTELEKKRMNSLNGGGSCTNCGCDYGLYEITNETFTEFGGGDCICPCVCACILENDLDGISDAIHTPTRRDNSFS